MNNLLENLLEQREYLLNWLHSAALPLWWSAGADKIKGGFEELLDLNGKPLPADRRFRVQPRQLYCYVAAGRTGWTGPWQEAVEHGLQYFESRYLLDVGYFASTASMDGVVINREFDLYNQAFGLFAYAQMSSAQPELSYRHEKKALKLLASLAPYRHSYAGFEEGLPRKLPLCSNPHMHLLEAALEWEMATPTANPVWTLLADEIAQLCLSRFIDPASGCLREFFDGDWKPYPGSHGRIIEPGHQFEWAWLLIRWGQNRKCEKAIEAACRLFELGITYGICDRRQTAVMQLLDDFSTRDATCRLWPQTEWVKAALVLASISGGGESQGFLREALRGIKAMRRFLDEVPRKGLWRDRMLQDGQWLEEAVPASTFYHIVGAVVELDKALRGLHKRKTIVME